MAIPFTLTPDKTTPGLFDSPDFNALVNALTATVAAYPMANIPTPASLGLYPNKTTGQKMTSAEFNNIVTILGGVVGAANTPAAPVTTQASAPTGSFNPLTRIYTVNIGSYALSRLLVSTQYGVFAAATTLAYQVGDAYQGPEYWRFKIAATGNETESPLLLSPNFPAKGILVDMPVGIMGPLQSNGSGLGQGSRLTPTELAPVNLGFVAAYTRNAIEQYQVMVNGEGIKKNIVDPTGTNPLYEDGFGMDMQYMQRVQLANAGPECIIKKNISRGVTTDNATFGKWETSLYAEHKQEILQAFTNLNAMGYRPVVKWLYFDVYESAPSDQTDYINGALALLQHYIDDGFITLDTPVLVRYGYRPTDTNVNQAALIATNPARFKKVDVGVQPTIEGTHITDVGQRAEGNEVYNVTHNTTTPVVTPPASGGSGNVGTYPIQSNYNNLPSLVVVARNAPTLIANGFTFGLKVTIKYIGASFAGEKYFFCSGDLGAQDENVTLAYNETGDMRVRIKTDAGFTQPLFPVGFVADSEYDIIGTVTIAGTQVTVVVYVNGTKYTQIVTGTLAQNTAPNVYGGAVVNGANTASLIGDSSNYIYVNRPYSEAESLALFSAGMVMTQAQIDAPETIVYAPGLITTPSAATTVNLADTTTPLLVTRY